MRAASGPKRADRGAEAGPTQQREGDGSHSYRHETLRRAKPLVVRIELTDMRGAAGLHYLLLRRSEVSLCATNPGFPEELCLRADRRTLIRWWRGDLTFR
jgi:hypothetical protein